MREVRRDQHKKLLSLAISGEITHLADQLSAYLSECPDHHVGDVVHPKTGDGLLHVAARAGHLPCLQHLVRKVGCQVDQRNLEFKTALHEAAQTGHQDAVRLLLEAGAEVDSLKRADWTPLMLAATKAGNVKAVELLLEAGAEPGTVNKDGWTALHLAVRTGDLELVRTLADRDPSQWLVLSHNNRSVLHTCCLAGLAPLLTWLLSLPSLQSLLNTRDSCGSTPLMEAARGDHLECVRLLLEQEQVQVRARDKMERTVSEVAAQAGAVKTIRYLREERGLDPRLDNSLHAAAREGQAEVLRYLLSLGTEVDTRDQRGRTALFLSVSAQHLQAAEVLLEAGADLDSRDMEGVEVRSLARKENMLALLKKYS